jgi:plasmid stabilization system protein ParE
MKRYAVVVAPSARRQAENIIRWLEENRGTSETFQGELDGALTHVSVTPGAAPVYTQSRGRVIRRLLLPRSSHHIYFDVDDQRATVGVMAIWHTSRGQGPELT